MRFPSPASFGSAADLRRHLLDLGAEIAIDDHVEGAGGPLGRPAEVGGRKIGNRFAVQPMEGWDANEDGTPSEDTQRRWRRFGRSGAKLVWGGEAFAVTADGRANPNQLFLNRALDMSTSLATLRDEILTGHREIGESDDDLMIGLQLTHSGRYARPTAAGKAPRIAARHPILDERVGVTDDAAVVTDDELRQIADSYVAAASLAQRVGFDFVDVKCCHGYLLHELLGARDREGPFGGDLAGRTALLRRIIAGIQDECPGLLVGVRVSIADVIPYTADDHGVGAPVAWPAGEPYRHGFGVDAGDPTRFSFDEPFALLAMLRELGVAMINLSIGSPYSCPHIQRPAAYPPCDGYRPPSDPLLEVARHLDAAAQCKRAFPDLLMVGSGYTYLAEFLPHVAQAQVRAGAVDFVGLGRMTLSYPELPRDVLRGVAPDRKLLCRTFSDCTTAPRNGMKSGCYPLDPHYRTMPEAPRVRALRRRD